MTYGTTSKRSCSDVSVLNGIGAERRAITASLAGLQPLGKTPLQASLARGIELLSKAEPVDTPKSLVLISDGIDTCGGDPCAMARTAAASGVDMKLHVVGFDVDAEARAQLQCIAREGGGQYFNAADTAGFAAAMREVVQVAQAEPEPEPEPEPESEPEPEPVNQRVFFDDFEGDALAEGDWVVNNRDSDAFIVEDGKLLMVSSVLSHLANDTPNRFVLKRPVPDGDWDAVITFNAELNRSDYVWFGLWTDAENYLGGEIRSAGGGGFLELWSRKASSGKKTVLQIGDRRNKFADIANKPHTLGLHKRGRNYHVTLSGMAADGKKRQHKMDKLVSLRLPGKALAIVAGKYRNAKGEVQALIDSIEITRVSE